MGRGVSVKIHGTRTVIDNLDEFEKKIQIATKKAIIQGALVDIETVAKRKLTTDKHIDTGRLRASIHTSYKKSPDGRGERRTTHHYTDNRGNNYVSDIFESTSNDFAVVVGTDVHYGTYIEALDSYIFYAYHKGLPKIKRRVAREVRKVLKGR